MNDLVLSVLNRIEIGVILIDTEQTIVLWNKYIERLSAIRWKAAVGKPLAEVCPIFKIKRYQDILKAVLVLGQSRFCSSKLHHSFIFPPSGERDTFRQNMFIETVTVDGHSYALIQIEDITGTVTNELRLTSLVNELRKGYLEVKENEELTRQLAHIDPLTNIYNRLAINEQTEQLFASPLELAGSAMLFLDLDSFKAVNDACGHAAGDFLLTHVAKLLTESVRQEDLVARLGGDEFLVLFRSMRDVAAAMTVGGKITEAIAKPVRTEDGSLLHVTASVGIALYSNAIQSANDYIKAADIAMYRAKRGGKNRVIVVEGMPKES